MTWTKSHFFSLAFVGVWVALGIGMYRLETTINHVEEIAVENRMSTCRFVEDRRRAYEETEQFIEDIESGRRPPIPGISLSDLYREQDSRLNLLQAFEPLDCQQFVP